MPNTRFSIRWPDGVPQHSAAPPTALGDLLEAGRTYAVDDFVCRSRRALTRAGDLERTDGYGHLSHTAARLLWEIERTAMRYSGGDVIVEQLAT